MKILRLRGIPAILAVIVLLVASCFLLVNRNTPASDLVGETVVLGPLGDGTQQNAKLILPGGVSSLAEAKGIAIFIAGTGGTSFEREVSLFAAISEMFLNRGYASLLVSKAGFMDPQYLNFTLKEHSISAAYAIRYCKSEISRDSQKPIVIVGHSEGCLIALLAAEDTLSRNDRMILLAPPCVSGYLFFRAQLALRCADAGRSEAEIISSLEYFDQAVGNIINGSGFVGALEVYTRNSLDDSNSLLSARVLS